MLNSLAPKPGRNSLDGVSVLAWQLIIGTKEFLGELRLLVECLPRINEALGSIPAPQKLDMVEYICNPSYIKKLKLRLAWLSI